MDWHFFVGSVKFSLERFLLPFDTEFSVQTPVFFRNKCIDLILAVADDPKCYRLNTPRTQTSLDLCPEKRTDAVSYHSIQHSSGLLCIYQIHIQIPWLLDRILHGCLGDLIKRNPAHFVRIFLQCLHQMPGNRLSFTVRVRCKINLICFLCSLTK